jgi:hypothetical protein
LPWRNTLLFGRCPPATPNKRLGKNLHRATTQVRFINLSHRVIACHRAIRKARSPRQADRTWTCGLE